MASVIFVFFIGLYFFVTECTAFVVNRESDFALVSQSKHFVDNTLLIRDIMNVDGKEKCINVITAPRGFGKTTILDMFRRFFGIQVNEVGKPRPIVLNTNRKVFCDKPLNICKNDSEFFRNHFGRYPAVYIDYKPLGQSKDVQSFKDNLQKVIRQVFIQHPYLAENETALWEDDEVRHEYVRYMFLGINETLNELEITGGFTWISRLLNLHFDTEVILLIDNYDSYCNTLLSGHNETVAKEIMKYLADISLSYLKNSPYVYKALLMGETRVTDVGKAPHDDFFLKYNFLDDFPVFQNYGFAGEELGQIVRRRIKDEDERNKTHTLMKKCLLDTSGYIVPQIRFRWSTKYDQEN